MTRFRWPRCGFCGWPLQYWNLRCPCWVNRETPRSAGVAKIVNAYVADVRGEDDDDARE
jgi:hypothetical protein